MVIQFSGKKITSHIVIWSILIIYLLSTTLTDVPYPEKLVYCGILYLCYILAFYGLILFVLPEWQKNKITFFTSFLILVVVYYAIGYVNWYVVYEIFIEKAEPKIVIPETRFFKRFSIWFLVVGLVALSFFSRKLSIHKIKTQIEKETVLLKKELNFLKNQFNPHITFNFLNHLYSIANKYSEETARGIEIYSDVLRYYTNNGPEEMVTVKSEVAYLDNYIELRKILSKQVFVNFETAGALQQYSIYPRILITFVENAFKHGIYNQEDNPIVLSLVIDGEQLEFETINGVTKNKKIVSSGIGLENVRQILNLRYNNKYSLRTEEKEDKYYCTLKLNLL